jgi:hypothetical protein
MEMVCCSNSSSTSALKLWWGARIHRHLRSSLLSPYGCSDRREKELGSEVHVVGGRQGSPLQALNRSLWKHQDLLEFLNTVNLVPLSARKLSPSSVFSTSFRRSSSTNVRGPRPVTPQVACSPAAARVHAPEGRADAVEKTRDLILFSSFSLGSFCNICVLICISPIS